VRKTHPTLAGKYPTVVPRDAAKDEPFASRLYLGSLSFLSLFQVIFAAARKNPDPPIVSPRVSCNINIHDSASNFRQTCCSKACTLVYYTISRFVANLSGVSSPFLAGSTMYKISFITILLNGPEQSDDTRNRALFGFKRQGGVNMSLYVR